MMDQISLESITLKTLNNLEWRLMRLEFLVTGSDAEGDTEANTRIEDEDEDDDEDQDDNDEEKKNKLAVIQRLQSLEKRFQKLANKSNLMSDLIQSQSRHLEIFSSQKTKSESIPPMKIEEKAVTVLAHAPLLQSTASQLRSLQTLPPTASFTNLLALAPRIRSVESEQLQIAHDITELQKRSAQAVLKWQQMYVVDQGQKWVKWEQKLRRIERDVKRREERNAIE